MVRDQVSVLRGLRVVDPVTAEAVGGLIAGAVTAVAGRAEVHPAKAGRVVR
jgi:hypothetical protein